MHINFKQPKYVIPIIILPFLFLFFYAYKNSFGNIEENKTISEEALQGNIQDVSEEVKNQKFASKLDAYLDKYPQADGYTAIQNLSEERQEAQHEESLYSDREKIKLDSINEALKNRYQVSSSTVPHLSNYASKSQPNRTRISEEDKLLADALSKISVHQKQQKSTPSSYETQKADDPMEVFKKQMAIIDSMNKANDPEYQAELRKNLAAKRRLEHQTEEREKKLEVEKLDLSASVFNTVKSTKEKSFIKAIIDENITGYAGSRLRIRLLEDIKVGKHIIYQGSYLYANITGFSTQRVTFSITSILNGNQILPVKLDLYDHDGMPGLYVPASAFREFSKELGTNSTSGITFDGAAGNSNELMMGVVQRMFQSTTTAMTKLIRQNKAHIKYNTQVYLIDPDDLKNINQ